MVAGQTDSALYFVEVDSSGNASLTSTFHHVGRDYGTTKDVPFVKLDGWIFCCETRYSGAYQWDDVNEKPIYFGPFYDFPNGGCPQTKVGDFVYGFNDSALVRLGWPPTTAAGGRIRKYVCDRIFLSYYMASSFTTYHSEEMIHHLDSDWTFAEGGSLLGIKHVLVSDSSSQSVSVYSNTHSSVVTGSNVTGVTTRGQSGDFSGNLGSDEEIEPYLNNTGYQIRATYIRYLIDAYVQAANFDVTFSASTSLTALFSAAKKIDVEFTSSLAASSNVSLLRNIKAFLSDAFSLGSPLSAHISNYVVKFASSLLLNSVIIGAQKYIVKLATSFLLLSSEKTKQGFHTSLLDMVSLSSEKTAIRNLISSFITSFVMADEVEYKMNKKALFSEYVKLASSPETLAGRKADLSTFFKVIDSIRGLRQLHVSFQSSLSASTSDFVITHLIDLVTDVVLSGTFSAERGFQHDNVKKMVIEFSHCSFTPILGISDSEVDFTPVSLEGTKLRKSISEATIRKACIKFNGFNSNS
ncbi:hypothetical protein DRN93_01420 [archaeon]|nr:MAG: hypothetical protein DRN93_01420 [archaeon]